MRRLPSVLAGLLLVSFSIVAAGQITNGLVFETTFAFYAGNAKLPAGSYRVSPVGNSENLLQIESMDGAHSAFLEFTPTQAENPHRQSDVTFKKYGQVDFLNLLWVQGQTSGMEILPTKAEKMAAKTGTATRHSLPVKGGG
jgi:hypothetical protein